MNDLPKCIVMQMLDDYAMKACICEFHGIFNRKTVLRSVSNSLFIGNYMFMIQKRERT